MCLLLRCVTFSLNVHFVLRKAETIFYYVIHVLISPYLEKRKKSTSNEEYIRAVIAIYLAVQWMKCIIIDYYKKN